MRDAVITLYTNRPEKDENGILRDVLTCREVYCQVGSITRQEFFDAGRNGLNPQFIFYVFAGDYNNEMKLSFEGKDYGIYRTFLDGDYIELYAERKGGTNGRTN